MHIIAFSDLHIAHKMIDEEILENLESEISRLVREDSIICFTGDLLHKKVDLHDVYAQQAVKLCKSLDMLNIPVIVIDGTFSHDYKYIDTFLKIGLNNFTFIQNLSEVKIKNNIGEELDVLCIPEEYVEDQHEYYKNTVYNKKKVYDLVLMHGTFTDVLFHNVNIEADTLRKAPKFDSKDFSRHTLTLSGHIHRHQVLGKKKNVIYIGSYSNMNFGEDRSCHLLSIEFNKESNEFSFECVENIKTHKFEEIVITDENIDKLESVIIPKIKNKDNRTHYKVTMKVDDKSYISILKEMHKSGYIRRLIIDNSILCKENKAILIEEKQENIDYGSIYSGPIEEQIQTYLKTVHSRDVSIETIKNVLQK